MATDPLHLPPFDLDDAETLNVIIDTLKPLSGNVLNGYFAAGVSFAIFAPTNPSNLAVDRDRDREYTDL
jgi:hypothetical protein